ncbi:hypothetical protein STSP2_01649 [Anaerohalosphaera lusitana]|uniref:Uncharacterized protein n=1 Tax=Anaerohalosphaera lusitana TaxID=1936003 RepID=A0A1U9NKZ1_9BACT|nr:hypothetical protein [Anaerohalosphaera lusitana]AQT68485.1 hypothetical protein STSP2_01649 [Anaerohalosphaera lusitana]
MRKIITASLIVAIFSGFAFAGPVNMKVINKDAKVAMHVDMEKVRASDLGKLVMAEAENIEKPAEFLEFEKAIGGQLLQQTDGITVYGSTPEMDDAVALVKGRFDNSKIENYLKTIPAQGEEYTNSKVYARVEGKDIPAVGLMNKLAIIGDSTAYVQKAIDVVNAGSGVGSSDKFSVLKSLDQNTLFAVECDDASVFSSAAGEGPQPAKMVKKLSAVGSEKDGNFALNVNLETFDDKQAKQVQQSIQMMMMFMTMGQEQPDPELMTLVQSIKVNSAGSKVAIDFEYPSEKLFNLFKDGNPLKTNMPQPQSQGN